MLRTLNEAVEKQPSPKTQPPAANIASSFNGRTADSDSAYRGSNPWEATNTSQFKLPRTSPNILVRDDVLPLQQLIQKSSASASETVRLELPVSLGDRLGIALAKICVGRH